MCISGLFIVADTIHQNSRIKIISNSLLKCFFKLQVILFCLTSLNQDASGKEISDSFEGSTGGGKGDGKPRKHHRKSARTRSRQEKINKPKLSMLNVRIKHVFFWKYNCFFCDCLLKRSYTFRLVIQVTRWWNASWRHTIIKW